MSLRSSVLNCITSINCEREFHLVCLNQQDSKYMYVGKVANNSPKEIIIKFLEKNYSNIELEEIQGDGKGLIFLSVPSLEEIDKMEIIFRGLEAY